MQIFHGADSLPLALNRSVLALGNFDGIHKGHQSVLNVALEEAEKSKYPIGIMVFEPHPREYFQSKSLFRLSPLDVKATLGEAIGLDYVLVMEFNASLASLKAEEFVNDILIEKLNVSHVVAGFNFHFGKSRQGTPQFLQKQGQVNDFGVTIVEPAQENEEVFSSSRIRAALREGRIEDANEDLGYNWFVRGEIVKGDQRGRELGYPTANVALPESCELKYGVYAVRARLRSDDKPEIISGVASFGVRPTFGLKAPLLEVHLFDFNANLYGKSLDIEFISFIREELKFDDVDALISQMNADSEIAKQRLIIARERPATGLQRALESKFV